MNKFINNSFTDLEITFATQLAPPGSRLQGLVRARTDRSAEQDGQAGQGEVSAEEAEPGRRSRRVPGRPEVSQDRWLRRRRWTHVRQRLWWLRGELREVLSILVSG